jgi:hypothetical protein
MTALALLVAQVPPTLPPGLPSGENCHPVGGGGSGLAFVCTYDRPSASASGGHFPWPIFLFFVALWVIGIAFAFYASKDMERRGQPGGVWFALVFFAGFIGILIWLYTRDNYPVLPERPKPPQSPYGGAVPLGTLPWSGSQSTTDQW